jgi:hypothetical protein
MIRVGNVLFLVISILAIGGFVSAEENNQNSANQLLDSIPGMPVPKEMNLEIGSVAIEKKGEGIFGKQLKSLLSTFDVPNEERLIARIPMDNDLFMEIWEKIKSFDFKPYENLKPTDFISEIEPSDACIVHQFFLEIDGKLLFRLNIGSGQFKDEKLAAKYHDFMNLVSTRIDIAKARPAILWLKTIKLPKTMAYTFASYNIYRGKDNIKVGRYFYDDAGKKYIKTKAPVFEKAAGASKEVAFSGGSIDVYITEKEFSELWDLVKDVDFVRFINTKPEDFVMKKQNVTYSFGLSVERRSVCGWNHLDRELKDSSAGPLLKINKLIDSIIDAKVAKILKN